METSITERNIGVNFNTDGAARIRLWAPMAKSVVLKISDGATLPLDRLERGYWFLDTAELKPGDQYRFVLDGGPELPDPASLSQPGGVHGPSQAIDLKDFGWTDQYWLNPDQSDYIFYELHTGTFSPDGTFAGIEKKLDHLLKLGITAVEIMPVAQFPGDRNWGYDGVFPFAVQNSYGGAKELQKLVNACHSRGLAVVLDVVYNHIGPEGNYLPAYAPYFTGKYKTPWGDAINFDDAWCDGVRGFFIENALMWLRDFHIDALRLDAVHAIKDFSPKHILREIKERVDALAWETKRQYHLIVECDLNDPRFINDRDGYGMNAQWTDEFHHALRVSAGQPQQGYYSDFNGLPDLAKAYKDAYVYTGQYSDQRHKNFGVKTSNPGKQFVVFSQNHDQVGNRMLGERTSTLVSFEMQKLMAAAVMLSPYLPMLFMGEEYGETNPFLYFVSHGDKDLIEAVRKGRKEEFKDFHGDEEAPDPQAGETFTQSKLQWNLLSQPQHQAMFSYYRQLILLRKTEPALKLIDRKKTDAKVDGEILYLFRWDHGQDLVAILNFSDQPRAVTMHENLDMWQKILDSADPKWNGPAAAPALIQTNIDLILQPQSVVVYAKYHV